MLSRPEKPYRVVRGTVPHVSPEPETVLAEAPRPRVLVVLPTEVVNAAEGWLVGDP
jgi:hypothetical protein